VSLRACESVGAWEAGGWKYIVGGKREEATQFAIHNIGSGSGLGTDNSTPQNPSAL
jgi:hypothetical protein